ncbi:MAG: DNA-3-methyladenine glycosylase [Halobacteriaceae archaeon]
MTDADADDVPEPIREDPHLGPLVEEHGPVTVDSHDDPFARLVTSVVNQQLSTRSAAAIRDRLFERFDVTPAGVAAADPDALRETGLSGQKVEYLKHAADAFQERELSPTALADHSDEEAVDLLTEIRGVGEWTAHMYLIFVCGREDVFPVGDLGVRKGMCELFDAELSRAEMVERASAWRPYRSYAALYLWRAYD